MLFKNTTRKLQLGGSLNLAKNEAAPVNIMAKPLDISGFKQAQLEVPNSMMDDGNGGSGSGSRATVGGLPSDIAYVQDKLDSARQKIKDELTGPNAKDYLNSAKSKTDSDEVSKWAEAKATLRATGEDFKTTKTFASKAADNLAISNGKALAKDSTTGEYVIVDADEALTSRIKGAKGSISPRYAIARIGEALNIRANNPKFSVYNDEEGSALSTILETVKDSKTVEDEMDKTFSKVGSISENKTTIVDEAGKTTSIEGLLGDLTKAHAQYIKGSVKTNQYNLAAAVDLFKKNLSVSQIDALRSKAIAQYIEQHGDKAVNPESAKDWIEAQVNANIAERAAIYLKTAQGKTIGGNTKGGSNDPDDISKKVLDTNTIGYAIMEPGKRISIEGGYDGAKELHDHFSKESPMAHVLATEVGGANDLVVEGAGGVKGTAFSLDKNDFIRKVAREGTHNNLFLADGNSTPVDDLNDKQGLSSAIVNTTPTGGPMKVLHSMPYTIDDNGQYHIAWTEVGKATQWADEVTRLTNKEFEDRHLDKSKATLPEDIRRSIEITAANNVKWDPNNNNVKVGEIAMIPILVATHAPRWDEKVGNVLSSVLTKAEETAIDPYTSTMHGRHGYKTFAFSVLPDGADAMFKPDFYGEKGKMPTIKVGMLLPFLQNKHRIDEQGFDFTGVALDRAHVDQTAQ